MVGKRSKGKRTCVCTSFWDYNWNVRDVHDLWDDTMDDITKRTRIRAEGKQTKSDLVDFWTWVCVKAERLGFMVEQIESDKPNPKTEYIKKITG